MSSEALVLQSTPIITAGYVMQVVLSLLIVIAFIYVIARFVLPRFKITTPGRLIQVADRVYLEPGVTAYILRVGKRSWLVATSSKNIETISEIEAA